MSRAAEIIASNRWDTKSADSVRRLAAQARARSLLVAMRFCLRRTAKRHPELDWTCGSTRASLLEPHNAALTSVASMKTKSPAQQHESNAQSTKPQRNKPKTSRRSAGNAHATNASSTDAARTKSSRLVALMRRKGGTTIDQAASALGWQPHSVRGLISAVVRKKLGLTVRTDRNDKGRLHYRIVR